MSGAKNYTVDDLLISVKRRITVPEAEGVLSDADILRFANEEIDESLGPLILSTKEEFFLTYEDIVIPAGITSADIPYRAFGTKIRIIKPLATDGSEGYPLAHIPLDDAFEYQGVASGTSGTYGQGFYLRNDKIVLLNRLSGNTDCTIRVYFYIRPNDLVELDQGGTITAINSLTNTLSFSKLPTAFIGTKLFDFIQALPNHRIYSYDKTGVVNTVTKTIAFSAGLPDDLQVGDFLCLAGQTVTPQIPVDVNPLLEQAVANKISEAIGDTEGLKTGQVRMEKLEMRLQNLINPRVESPSVKAVNKNSLLRSARRFRRRF